MPIINKKLKGREGENVGCDFLKDNGFKILDRNYQQKWGELDIVAEKEGIVHFFEVKSVTHDFVGHQPEDNVHGLKTKHLRRIIETYLEDKKRGLDAEFYFHVLCVFLNMQTRRAKVRWIKDIIL